MEESEVVRRLRRALRANPDVPDPDWIEEIEGCGIDYERAVELLELAREGHSV